MNESICEYYTPKNVGELRELLYRFPDDMRICTDGVQLLVELIIETVDTGQLKLPNKYLNFS